MQTKDVTKLLKIKKERIRYYREQDVFWPEYGVFQGEPTEYTERDLFNLKRLEVLTKAGLTCGDIKKIQTGAWTFEEACKKRRKAIEEDLKRKENALRLSEELLALGVGYDTMPADDLWEDVRRREGAGEEFMDLDYGYASVPLTRSIRCPHCGAVQEVDLEDYLYDETCNESTHDDDMGTDIVYSFDTEDVLMCEVCGKQIHIEGWIREYPDGAYDSEHIGITKGGEV